MRAHHLVGAHTRRRWRTARSDVVATAADLVRRNFDPTGPDVLWAADVTQIRTGEGWLYLAAVLDLWSRRVVGWAMGSAVNAELVGDALLMAFQRRRPDRRVVHHSDRGAVYTSLAFSTRLAELELDQSFSAVGSCYDNAAVESFFATLKRELAWIHQRTTWPTRAAAADRTVRLHRRLLQPRTHPTAPRPPQPHRLRTPRSRVTTTCPPNRVKTSGEPPHRVGVMQLKWIAGPAGSAAEESFRPPWSTSRERGYSGSSPTRVPPATMASSGWLIAACSCWWASRLRLRFGISKPASDASTSAPANMLNAAV